MVSGPVALAPVPFVRTIPVTTAQEMFEAVRDNLDAQDILIKSAAVADYRPSQVSEEKVKKSDGEMSIELERTQDILGYVASTAGKIRSSAVFPWRLRICWRIPGKNWTKRI